MGYWARVYVNDDGTITFEDEIPKSKKNKNTSCRLNYFIDDFTVLDIETTGFSNKRDDIIEISCLKVRNNIVIDNLDMLIKPATSNCISNKITNLTGITTEMLSDGSEIEDALKSFLEFLEDDIIVGHNVSFDISFLNNKIDSYFDCDFNVDYVDTLYLSREKFPELNSHKLSFLSQVLNLNKKSSHRALDDCYATLELYELCRSEKNNDNSNIIKCTNDFTSVTYCNIEKDNNISDKHFCFTGTLINLSREDAINKCISLGAISDSTITLKTNYLVIGIQDYAQFADGKESSKTKKAKQLIEKGQDLQIIDENYFISLISLQ